MAYPEYDPNEPSLGQTFADLLRGVKNPKSWQEVGQGIQNVAKITPSVVESMGRGGLVTIPAFAGDVSQTARQIAPETMQNTFGNRYMPTSEEILAKVPRMTPDYQGSQSHEMMGGLLSPAMPFLLRAGAEASKGLPIGNMIAYHGTPHDIKNGFDISKVGTGEGAQAYGHGMYFAESPKVAEKYQKAFDQSSATVKALQKFRDDAPLNSDEWHHYDELMKRNNKGNLYKVDIPDEHIPNMLDWDKPLSQQPKSVQNALAKYDPDLYSPKGNDYDSNELGQMIYNRIAGLENVRTPSPTNANVKATNKLNELGITGIRYFDAGSRPTNIIDTRLESLYQKHGGDVEKAADDFMRTIHESPKKKAQIRSGIIKDLENRPTSNFVVFDPSTVKILEKNGQPTRKEIIEQQIKKIE
jgi:hypothetical protein